MQIKRLTVTLMAAASLAACTTHPVVVNTPGPGTTTIQVPVPATPEMSLTNRVKTALTAGMGSDAAGIDVRVEGTTVYLTGHVATSALRGQAHSVAHGTQGVTSVVDEGLTVQ